MSDRDREAFEADYASDTSSMESKLYCVIECYLAELPKRHAIAMSDIETERQRQIEIEGWTPEHDDKHRFGQLALAGACYALSGAINDVQRASLARVAYDTYGSDSTVSFKQMWPWELTWWKPKERRRDLVRAAALIVAEIERMDRAKVKALNSPALTRYSEEDEPCWESRPREQALISLVQEAAKEIERLRRCLGFFSSVIKSGEPWTETCQREYDKALNHKQEA